MGSGYSDLNIYLFHDEGKYGDSQHTISVTRQLLNKCKKYLKITYEIKLIANTDPLYHNVYIYDGKSILSPGELIFSYYSPYWIEEVVDTIYAYFCVLLPTEPLVISFVTRNKKTYDCLYQTLKSRKSIEAYYIESLSFNEDLVRVLEREYSNFSKGNQIQFLVNRNIKQHILHRAYEIGTSGKFKQVIYTSDMGQFNSKHILTSGKYISVEENTNHLTKKQNQKKTPTPKKPSKPKVPKEKKNTSSKIRREQEEDEYEEEKEEEKEEEEEEEEDEEENEEYTLITEEINNSTNESFIGRHNLFTKPKKEGISNYIDPYYLKDINYRLFDGICIYYSKDENIALLVEFIHKCGTKNQFTRMDLNGTWWVKKSLKYTSENNLDTELKEIYYHLLYFDVTTYIFELKKSYYFVRVKIDEEYYHSKSRYHSSRYLKNIFTKYTHKTKRPADQANFLFREEEQPLQRNQYDNNELSYINTYFLRNERRDINGNRNSRFDRRLDKLVKKTTSRLTMQAETFGYLSRSDKLTINWEDFVSELSEFNAYFLKIRDDLEDDIPFVVVFKEDPRYLPVSPISVNIYYSYIYEDDNYQEQVQWKKLDLDDNLLRRRLRRIDEITKYSNEWDFERLRYEARLILEKHPPDGYPFYYDIEDDETDPELAAKISGGLIATAVGGAGIGFGTYYFQGTVTLINWLI